MNSSKKEIVLSHDSKVLFMQRFVKVLNQNRNQRTGTPVDFAVPW